VNETSHWNAGLWGSQVGNGIAVNVLFYTRLELDVGTADRWPARDQRFSRLSSHPVVVIQSERV
jgi:hypothetical protein